MFDIKYGIIITFSINPMSTSSDTLAGDIIILQIPTDPPYGVAFGPDLNGNGLVVKSFEKLPTGKFGLIQKHGGIHYDDVLFEINDIPLYNVSHQDALNMLLNSNTLNKTVKFKNKKEYYRNSTRLKNINIIHYILTCINLPP